MREQLQKKFVEDWLNSSRRTILKVAPRVGKCKISLEIAKRLGVRKMLVVFPRNDIQSSWENEKIKWGYDIELVFTTYKSLHKHTENYELRAYDELHEASEANLIEIDKNKDQAIGLSGSMTKTTESKILEATGMYVCSEYSIAQAVEDGIICDYEINVHKLKLIPEDKRKFNSLHFRWEKAKGAYKRMLELQIISFLQTCKTKELYTKELIKKYADERILVFCGQTDMADRLGIPVYHSKNKEKQIFDDFCQGKGQHLACCQLIQAGITILPINRGIINYTSGSSENSAQKICRFLGKELYAPDKKAIIDFLAIDEPFSMQRTKTALLFFDESKIIYK